jgi:hypothetical protein
MKFYEDNYEDSDDFFQEQDYQEDEFSQLVLNGTMSSEMNEIEREVQMELIADELAESDETYREAA